MIHLWPFYGLLGAPWPRGFGYSKGVDVLSEKIASKFGAVRHPTRCWGEWEPVVGEIPALPASDKVILLGHSYGAYSCTKIAEEVEHIHFIDALLSFDASIFPPGCPVPLRDNVGEALSIVGLGLSIPGHCPLTAAPGSWVKIADQDTYQFHTLIDDTVWLHDVALHFVGEALA